MKKTIHDPTRRRLLLGAASALAVMPARARADFVEALVGGFSAGMNSGTPGDSAAVRQKIEAQQKRLAITPEFEAASRNAEAYFRAKRLTRPAFRPGRMSRCFELPHARRRGVKRRGPVRIKCHRRGLVLATHR